MMTRRVLVISDLHLGGEAPRMMSRPRVLAEFIDRAPDGLADEEELELVIAGDFIDFLAIEPNRCWTPEPEEAVTKLRKTTAEPPFDVVFAALANFVASGHRLTILLGNHDVELALPTVQDALLSAIGATRHQVLFVDDGRAYRVGKTLIEHGNRYDGANENDWAGLRAVASALSRHETPNTRLQVSFGSQIVEKVICPIKRSYPFIDLLQPQDELVALLLLAFEPSLIWNLNSILQLYRADRLQRRNAEGFQPGETRHVSFSSLEIPYAPPGHADGGEQALSSAVCTCCTGCYDRYRVERFSSNSDGHSRMCLPNRPFWNVLRSLCNCRRRKIGVRVWMLLSRQPAFLDSKR